MPTPRSAISTIAGWRSLRTRTVISLIASEYFTALSSRLASTCSSAAGSTWTYGPGPVDVDGEREVMARQAVRKGVHRFARERAEVDMLELVAAILLHAREFEHALHQRRQPRRFGADGVEILAELLGRSDAVHLQRLGGRAQQRQRRLELMRDVGHEVGLHLGELRRSAMRLHRQVRARPASAPPTARWASSSGSCRPSRRRSPARQPRSPMAWWRRRRTCATGCPRRDRTASGTRARLLMVPASALP